MHPTHDDMMSLLCVHTGSCPSHTFGALRDKLLAALFRYCDEVGISYHEAKMTLRNVLVLFVPLVSMVQVRRRLRGYSSRILLPTISSTIIHL